MPEFHAEHLHVAGVSASALISWGAFYFRVRGRGGWKLVDDRDRPRASAAQRQHWRPLRSLRPCAGHRLRPRRSGRGDRACETTNWCHLTGLTPDTPYTYEVVVNDEIWAEGDLATTGGRAPSRGLIRPATATRTRFARIPLEIASRWGR